MGTLCSPDNVEKSGQAAPNIVPSRKRTNKNHIASNTCRDDSASSIENSGRPTQTDPSQSNTYNASGMDADLLDDLSVERSISQPSKQYDIVDDNESNRVYEDETDKIDNIDNSQKQQEQEQEQEQEQNALKEPSCDEEPKGTPKKKSGLLIVVTPADKIDFDNLGYSPIPNGAKKQTDGNENDESGTNKEPEIEEEDLILKKRKQRVDSTLNGAISWRKVADFSALLPRDVKLKLWKGVFKTESDYTQPEQKRISKVLRTFVMLQLTRV